MPLVLGSWLMAWRGWLGSDKPGWVPKIIVVLTLVYLCSQLLGLTWLPAAIPHALFQSISNYVRLLFVLLLIFITYRGISQKGREGWLALPAILLISTGLFAQELLDLHVPGIWFPFGVGVSRTQYAYAAFDVAMLVLLVNRRREKHYIKNT